MRGFRSATWPRIVIVSTAMLALAACSEVDEDLFGPYPANQEAQAPANSDSASADSTSTPPQPAAVPASQAQTPLSDQTAEVSPSSPPPADETETPPSTSDEQTAMAAPAESPSESSSGETALPGTLPAVSETGSPVNVAISTSITAIRIEPGRETGTAVGKTVAGLRGEIEGLDRKLMQNAHRLDELRGDGVRATSGYQDARAKIMTRLQMGTTHANPELVSLWNEAQSELDRLSANINSLAALGADVANDSTSAQQGLRQITAAYDLTGAVDEDHRQLTTLEDETRQMIVLYDRLRTDVMLDVPRETKFVADERASLARLASDIKRGALYSDAGGTQYTPARMASTETDSTEPLVVIKFDHPDVAYQQILLAALQQALKNRPGAEFKVVAVAPTRGSASDVEKAQGAAKRHAQDVLRTMTEMGVPAARLQVASSTDPGAHDSEVRVFLI